MSQKGPFVRQNSERGNGVLIIPQLVEKLRTSCYR
jgi:hypothetical protein